MKILLKILFGGFLLLLYNKAKDVSFNGEGILMMGIIIIIAMTAIYIYNAYLRDKRKDAETSALERLTSIDNVINAHYLNGRKIKPRTNATTIDNNNKTPINMENHNNDDRTYRMNGTEPVDKVINAPEHIGTRDLLFNTLTELGCQWTIDEDNNQKIHLTYQGGHFFVYAADDSPFITVYYLFWNGLELYDIDNLARWKKAINDSNSNSNVTSFYAINEAEGLMYVHSKIRLLFMQEMPYLDNLLQVVLNSFFQVRLDITNEVYKLRIEEENKK